MIVSYQTYQNDKSGIRAGFNSVVAEDRSIIPHQGSTFEGYKMFVDNTLFFVPPLSEMWIEVL